MNTREFVQTLPQLEISQVPQFARRVLEQYPGSEIYEVSLDYKAKMGWIKAPAVILVFQLNDRRFLIEYDHAPGDRRSVNNDDDRHPADGYFGRGVVAYDLSALMALYGYKPETLEAAIRKMVERHYCGFYDLDQMIEVETD